MCVSTAMVGAPNTMFRMTFAVLRPTPGSDSSASRSLGTSPPCFSTSCRHKLDEVLRLRVVEPDGLDVRLHAFDAQRQDRLRRVGDREQHTRRGVDALVRGVRREHHGDEQLERRRVLELRGRARIRGLQAAIDRADSRWIHVLRYARRDCLRSREQIRMGSARDGRFARCALRNVRRFACAVGARYSRASSARGIITMQSTGQGATHSSQPVQSSATTVCICRRMPTIASTGHGGRHFAQPMQRSSSIWATSAGPSTPFAGFNGMGARPSSAASAVDGRRAARRALVDLALRRDAMASA